MTVSKKASQTKMQAARKRRTREHVIEALSVAHLQYFVANAGFTMASSKEDYGYDLVVTTFDRDGYMDPMAVYVQLKASERLTPLADGVSYCFDLDVRDDNQWADEINPVFLILYEASSIRAYWLYFQEYLRQAGGPKPKKGARTIRVRVPKGNRVKTSFFRHARHLKQKVHAELGGGKADA
ncbi:hypothetical protein OJF2_39410 [Aquisphaera giovannonii]|uniref:DUF4365 domain-containing protein n=1 Tax=Aquisphaera giovannonii TaxID=406548 RepID=A0A5B9W5H2_9BACT|nr:DUF4365 domain-containing protein [Aquisphaera giovannonii]QEH35389.1 hypothetical protein OJF2_39410 [Aquisphaera giovannonii]